VLQEIFDMGLAHIIENGQYSKIMAFDGSDYAQVVEPSSIK
jgi:polar amino acid transport system substrate-binding protein